MKWRSAIQSPTGIGWRLSTSCIGRQWRSLRHPSDRRPLWFWTNCPFSWAPSPVGRWASHTATRQHNRRTESSETGYGIVARNRQAPHLRYLIADRHVGALLQAGRIFEADHLAEQMGLHSADLPGAAPLLTAAIAGRAALAAGRVNEAHALLAPVIDVFFATGDVNGLGYRYQIDP